MADSPQGGQGEGLMTSLREPNNLKDNDAMSGIQFVTDEKGRKVAVQIDLKEASGTVGGYRGCTCLPLAAARKANSAREGKRGPHQERQAPAWVAIASL